MRKIFALCVASTLLISGFALAADTTPESKENVDAATVLYQKGVTKVPANATSFYETLSRKNAALLLKRFATEVMQKQPESSEGCAFSDLGSLNTDDRVEIIEACALGLFKGKNGKFMPNDLLTRAQLITVIGRIIGQNNAMEKDEAYDLLLHLGLVKVDDRADETTAAMRKDIYIIMHRVIVSLSQIVAYQPFVDGFSVGKTIAGNNTTTPVKPTANSPYKEVLKIVAYKKNDIFGTYATYQLGSAVIIDDGLIVTNAHVVLNEEGEEIGNYEVCNTTSQNSKPVCISTAKLLYYDVDTDLALLSVKDSSSLPKPVVFASKAPRNGEDVHVWGYPGIGGTTITYTKGIISGVENGKYKSDVKIDHGNSGGGAFNKQGQLIGIPNSATYDTDTLSYIIPYTSVQAFLNKEGDITEASSTEDSEFTKYIAQLEQQEKASSIDTPFFTLPSLGNLSIEGYAVDSVRNLYAITLSDSIGNTQLSINTYAVQGTKKTLLQEDTLSQCESSQTGSKILGGKTWLYTSCINPSGQKASVHLYEYKEGDYAIDAMIVGRGENAKNIQNALSVLEKITMKTFPSKTFALKDVGPVQLPSIDGSNILYSFGDCGCISVQASITAADEEAKASVVFTEIDSGEFATDSKDKSLFSYLDQENDFFTDPNYYEATLSGTLLKNKTNSVFYLVANYDEEADLRNVIAVTLVKLGDKIYDISLYFTYDGEQNALLEKKILEYLDGIKINADLMITNLGKTPISISEVVIKK